MNEKLKEFDIFEREIFNIITRSSIKKRIDIDNLYLSYEKSYTGRNFHVYAFLLYYKNNGTFKNSLFKKSYYFLNQYSDEQLEIFYHYFKKDSLKFLDKCQKFEPVPFFITRPNHKEISLFFLIQSLKRDLPSQLQQDIKVISFILSHNPNFDIKNESMHIQLPKSINFKFWQLRLNPYVKDNKALVYVCINKKKIQTSIENAICWNWLITGSSMLLSMERRNSSIELMGYDNCKHSTLLSFLKSFKNQAFVQQHLNQFICSKSDNASVNKSIWSMCQLALSLIDKRVKSKPNKI